MASLLSFCVIVICNPIHSGPEVMLFQHAGVVMTMAEGAL